MSDNPGPAGGRDGHVQRLPPHRLAFRFGLISDVQYADIDDALNYTKTERRSYRRALLGLRQSIDTWNALKTADELAIARLDEHAHGAGSADTDDDAAGGGGTGGAAGGGSRAAAAAGTEPSSAQDASTNSSATAQRQQQQPQPLPPPPPFRSGVAFVLQLGDLIDGQNSGTYAQGLAMAAPQTAHAMAAVRREVARCHCQDWRNVMGNHELLNYPKRDVAREALSLGARSFHAHDADHPSFYSFHAPSRRRPPSAKAAAGGLAPAPAASTTAAAAAAAATGMPANAHHHHQQQLDDGLDDQARDADHHHRHTDELELRWRFIVLDSFDVGVIGRDKSDPSFAAAARILNANNPNNVVDGDGSGWFDGLKGVQKRFVPYNGAVGEQQLQWLRGQLAEAAGAGEQVIVSAHVPMHPDASDDSALLWNFDEVMGVLHSPDGLRCVVAILAGHYHSGARCTDEHGITHVTVEAPLTYGLDGEKDEARHSCSHHVTQNQWPFADVEVEHDVVLPTGELSVGHLRCFGNGACQSDIIEVPPAVQANVARVAAAKLAAARLAVRAHRLQQQQQQQRTTHQRESQGSSQQQQQLSTATAAALQQQHEQQQDAVGGAEAAAVPAPRAVTL